MTCPSNPSLQKALRRFLRENPSRRGEMPNYLGVAVWSLGWMDEKPTPEEVKVALANMRRARRQPERVRG